MRTNQSDTKNQDIEDAQIIEEKIQITLELAIGFEPTTA